jgi:hypothetical protein
MNRFRLALLLCWLPLHAQDVTTTPEMEKQIFEWTNQERAKVNVPPLKWNDRLAIAARLHSDEMAKHKDLSHQLAGEPVFTERLLDRGARFSSAAENVGFADDAETLQSGWMHSPPHRTNLLSPNYTDMGVGIVRSGDQLWATEDFATTLQRFSSEDFERAIEQEITSRRSARRLSPLQATNSPELRRIACSGDSSSHGAFGAVTQHYTQAQAFNFTAPRPDQLPSGLVKHVLDLPIGKYAIGACASQPDKNGLATYRVLVVLYQ